MEFLRGLRDSIRFDIFFEKLFKYVQIQKFFFIFLLLNISGLALALFINIIQPTNLFLKISIDVLTVISFMHQFASMVGNNYCRMKIANEIFTKNSLKLNKKLTPQKGPRNISDIIGTISDKIKSGLVSALAGVLFYVSIPMIFVNIPRLITRSNIIIIPELFIVNILFHSFYCVDYKLKCFNPDFKYRFGYILSNFTYFLGFSLLNVLSYWFIPRMYFVYISEILFTTELIISFYVKPSTKNRGDVSPIANYFVGLLNQYYFYMNVISEKVLMTISRRFISN